MDLLAFEAQELYFDEPVNETVQALLDKAAQNYGEGTAELPLLQAYLFEPENLSVLVALYRFFYYQHRLQETLVIAQRAMKLIGIRLNFPADWRALTPASITPDMSITFVRFYLFALKGAAYVNLRLGNLEEGGDMLNKILELDPEDRLGAKVLKNVLDTATRFRVVK
ncbi:hypothetical protein BegalDRAFT_0559 [Beggiatoa alba B18LD]|uniref:Tetratricopeptide repeat protein n=1 Tax=Beggiatoa alba B18LD TaxID=395493 RepID=I3CCY4_9GAMM|nr:hypothetical protein [Beggiatoa alba]EIJ41477.1 hypothetical protein BegalDRAFT_0559 [Beggiatoa alba B18LD]